MKRNLIMVCLIIISNVSYSDDTGMKLAYAMQYACDSFIKELKFQSDYAEFESCTIKEISDARPKPLVLKYKIKGEHVGYVEQQLHDTYQVTKFIKQESVALWETGNYYQLDNSKYIVDIIFVSQETDIQKREEWYKIPYFTLWFEKQLDF